MNSHSKVWSIGIRSRLCCEFRAGFGIFPSAFLKRRSRVFLLLFSAFSRRAHSRPRMPIHLAFMPGLLVIHMSRESLTRSCGPWRGCFRQISAFASPHICPMLGKRLWPKCGVPRGSRGAGTVEVNSGGCDGPATRCKPSERLGEGRNEALETLVCKCDGIRVQDPTLLCRTIPKNRTYRPRSSRTSATVFCSERKKRPEAAITTKRTKLAT
jgi:hypothetical protein